MSTEIENFHNLERCAVIKFLAKKEEIFEGMSLVFKDSASSYKRVKNLGLLFLQGNEICEVDPRQGRPVPFVIDENVQKVKKLNCG